MSWRDDFSPGDIVEGDMWDGKPGKLFGFVLRGDDGDDTILLLLPDGQDWEVEWVKTDTAVALEPTSPVARDLLSELPFEGLAPSYVFMVIGPRRQITMYANLDALLDGLTANVKSEFVDERKKHIREAAAEAIADPETDIKIPPGASNNPWLRFTQVQGA